MAPGLVLINRQLPSVFTVTIAALGLVGVGTVTRPVVGVNLTGVDLASIDVPASVGGDPDGGPLGNSVLTSGS